MKSLLFPKQILVRTMLGLILLALAQPGIAQDEEYVLLADSDSLSDEIHSELEQFLLEAPNDIERDQEQLAFITEEGQQIDFSSVFHKKRLRKSKEVAAIFEEYAPDYLILAWSDQKSATDSSYGLSKKGLTVHLRVLDGAGRNVHKGSAFLETKLGIAQPGLNELIVGAISEFDFLKLEDAIAKDTERKAKRGQRVKVVFKNLPQEDYFDKRDELIALIKAAGDVTKVRDKHDKSAEVLTVRAALKGDLDTFYRALYRSGLDLEGLDNFELDRKGNLFTFTALPASRKRLIIAGLSPDQYHHRLEIYRDSLSSIEGVKDVEFEFVRGAQDIDSKLIFTFSYRDDIHIVEEQVWKGLEGAGEAINRQLASISDTSIEYVAGIDVADLREVTLYVTQIDQDTYRSVDPPIQSTLESLGVRNLSGTYDSESAELIYRFEIGETTEFLTASIEGVIRSSPALENMVVESIRADEISFSFRKNIVTVAFNNIAPGDYGVLGTTLDTLIKDLGGRDVSRTYDDEAQVLTYSFDSGETVLHLDELIRQQIETTPGLDSIIPGGATDSSLAYSYLQENPLARSVTVLVEDLEPDASRNIARELIALVEETYGVERLRQDYADTERRLRLRFSYQGQQPFFSTLYPRLISNEALSYLGIERQGKKITLTPLPPERRRLVIAGLSAERYHHRLEAYRNAVASQTGVSGLNHEYLAGSADAPGQLVLSFSYGGNLATLEDHIWASLAATGETPNRQLSAVSERLIQYQVGAEAVLTAVFANVASSEYAGIRESLDGIFDTLGVRNLSRDYDDKTQTLSYRFESGQAMADLDSALGQQIEIAPALQGLVPGTATDTSLEYSFLKTIVTVAFNNLTSEDYGALGTTLDDMIEGLGGRDISKVYDDEAQLLSYRFDSGDTALHLDELIRQQIETTPGLDSIIPGGATDSSLAYSYLQENPLARSVTVLVEDLEPDASRNIARELIALVEETYGVERLRQDYADTERRLRLRFSYQGQQPFFSTLYPRLISNEALSYLGIERQGKKITLTPLPPERRRLVIAGLSAERYHHRLEAYRNAVASQTGVSGLNHEYLAGSADAPGQLVLSFSYGGNLATLEDHIWASLAATGETPNRQLSAVSERLIQYQVGAEAVLTAVFANVASSEYAGIRESLDGIFDTLGVRNLSRDYDDKTQTLSYRFESGQAMADLDSALGQQIEIAPALQGLVPGTATDTSLEYSFLKTIVTVAFNNIAPGDYREIGALLDTIIKQLEVEGLEKTYDPDGYRLSYTLETGVSPVQLDTILWERIRKEESLVPIVQDTTTGNALGYFYLQDRPATQHFSIVLKNLGPDAYRKAGRRFINTVKVISGIDRVRREYSEDDQVLRLLFTYSGESIYAIDDAIWETVRKDKVFSDLALGSISDVELVYVLGGEEGVRPGVVIHMRGVSGVDYKNISTAFSKLLGRLDNVRDVKYHYLFQRRTIVFHLRYEGGDLFALDDAIQQATAAHQLFQQISKGPDTAGRMIYLFGEEPAVTESGEPVAMNAEPDEGAAVPSSGSLPDLVAALDHSVILVLGESEDARWTGTGFFVTDSGYILTNAHVARGHLVHGGEARLWAKTLDGHRYPLNVIKSDNEQDLALLKIVSPTRQFESVKIGNSSQLRKGQQVFNIGNPGTWEQIFEHSVTIGVVAGLNRNDGLIEFSMPGRGGQSGSPVFNNAGAVVGVVVAVTLDDSGKAVIPVLMATVDTSGKVNFEVENKLIDVMTRNETITMAIPINHARNLLQLTGQ